MFYVVTLSYFILLNPLHPEVSPWLGFGDQQPTPSCETISAIVMSTFFFFFVRNIFGEHPRATVVNNSIVIRLGAGPVKARRVRKYSKKGEKNKTRGFSPRNTNFSIFAAHPNTLHV